MAVKTSYTEVEIQQYMQHILGDTARRENWTAEEGDFQEAANQVLYNLGWSDFTQVTTQDLAAEARAVAAVEAWRMAMMNTAHYAAHSVGAPGTGQTQRGDVHRFCRRQFDFAVENLTAMFPSSNALEKGTSRDINIARVYYELDDYDSMTTES